MFSKLLLYKTRIIDFYDKIKTLINKGIFASMVAPVGIEPTTPGFSVLCSTD